MKPIIRINNSHAESLGRVKGWFIAFGVLSILAGLIIFVYSDFEVGWELIVASIPFFILAGATNGFIGIARAAAIYAAKMEEEYDIKSQTQE